MWDTFRFRCSCSVSNGRWTLFCTFCYKKFWQLTSSIDVAQIANEALSVGWSTTRRISLICIWIKVRAGRRTSPTKITELHQEKHWIPTQSWPEHKCHRRKLTSSIFKPCIPKNDSKLHLTPYCVHTVFGCLWIVAVFIFPDAKNEGIFNGKKSREKSLLF